MRARFLGNFETIALEKDKIYNVISIEKGWLRILTEIDEDYLFPPEEFEIIIEENIIEESKYQYLIKNISISDNWIFIKCNDEDSLNDSTTFVYLLKAITKKLNDGKWKEKISSVGNMRYKIKNDPLNLIYQWDDLFGIVFEYSNDSNLDYIKTFIYKNYGIK